MSFGNFIFSICLYSKKKFHVSLKKNLPMYILLLTASDTGQNIRCSGVNSALRPSRSFVIAGFVFTYFTVILPGFQMLFVITRPSL